MLSVLCYGDSNTWGYIPGSGARFPASRRWPGVVQARLGASFRIIEAGLNGRTTNRDDPRDPGKNGLSDLLPTLRAHAPVDLVILMLGTNDLKRHLGASALDVARGVQQLVEVIRHSDAGHDSAAPRVMIVAPPGVGPVSQRRSPEFRGATQKSLHLPRHLARVAKQHDCLYLDAGRLVRPSPADSVHLGAFAHQRLAAAIAGVLAGSLAPAPY